MKLEQSLWSFSKNKASSEKPLIDLDVMDNWRGLGNYLSVSDDGNYFAYTINKMEYNDFMFGLFAVDSLVIQSTKNAWRTVFEGLQPGLFTADSRQYIFQDGQTLCVLRLGSSQLRKIADVTSFKVSQNKWLAYQLKGNRLNLQNLVTGTERQFPAVADYSFSNNGEWLIFQNEDQELSLYSLVTGTERRFSSVEAFMEGRNGLLAKAKDKRNSVLQYINFATAKAKIVWNKEKTSIGNYCIDTDGKHVAFNVVDSSEAANTGIWYYSFGLDNPVLKFSNRDGGVPAGLTLSDMSFTDQGRYLKVALQAPPAPTSKLNDDLAGLEVWNHKDLNLQSAQVKQLKQAKSYNSVFNIETGKLVFLESDDKKIAQIQGDFVLVKKDYKDLLGDRFWEQGKGLNQDSSWVISLKGGSSSVLPTRSQRCWFSPAGNYLLYFDVEKGCHYFSYDLNKGDLRCISANVQENQFAFFDRQHGNTQKSEYGNITAWIENEAAVLVYDNYDIWKLDLTGKKAAVNITNNFGQSNSLILNLFSTDHYSFEVSIIKANEALMLRGYDIIKKQSGFFKKVGVAVGAPSKLYVGNYFMNSILGCQSLNLSNRGLLPVKTKNSNSWIVQRQASSDAPNYYQTTDFINFKRLTNFQPHLGYQWLTEELVSFKHLDGKMGQGILYKPENFDPQKKYPVLIAFYENFSDNMHQFRDPRYLDQAMGAGKSPIWFLNNGYLVFAPDIAITPLKYGPRAFSVIEGAAQYLKQLPYVDGNKLGCASHSWSAKLGSYIFTHSQSIAATAISEGLIYANPVNMALSANDGVSRLKEVEMDQKFGSLWENKDLWLDQTTVLNVHKTNGPLLLFCNKQSSEDYQDQTFQFFNALRRLDKNVWWLKYDKGSHTLSDHKELQDYTIRYTQFFDHYLKDAPAPQWMTRGIPFKLKGIENRYELDPQGTCNAPNGEPCPVCQAWNKQYKRTPGMFQKEIKDWVLDKNIADELERKQNEKRKELDKQGEIQTKEVLRLLNK